MKTVYEKIEKLRKERNIDKKVLVEYLEISRQGFDSMMRNDTMTLKILSKIALYFNIEVKYFFDDVPIPKTLPDNSSLHEVIKAQRETIDTQKMLIEELKKNR